MADELSIITTNAAANGWVDSVPGAVSSGYQAQNTVISSMLLGIDESEVTMSGASVIIAPSGPVDINGQPFMVTTRTTLAPQGYGPHYIRINTGSTWNRRSLELSELAPTYDATKRGLYRGGTRYLNWIILGTRCLKIVNPGREGLRVENFLNIDNTATNFNFTFSAGDNPLFSRSALAFLRSNYYSKIHARIISATLGDIGGSFRVEFLAGYSSRANGGYVHVRSGSTILADYTVTGTMTKYSRDIPMSSNGRIDVWCNVHHRGAPHSSKYLAIANFKVGVAQPPPSSLMWRLMGGGTLWVNPSAN